MASVFASRLGRWRLLLVIAIGILYLSLFVSVCENFQALRKSGGHDYPFGIFATPGGGFFVQDFSYNMLFLRGIHERLVPRPYQLEGQAQMARLILPDSDSGMHHAYSPVAFVLTLLLPLVSNFQAYIIYFSLTGGGILLLTYFYLLPNVSQPLQIGALLVTLPSACTLTALAVGQTAMLTSVLLGVFWILLKQKERPTGNRVGLDFALALLFWLICLKPSVAVVPFLLLVGSQSWRAFAFGLGLLLATWNLVCGYYGGWWTGLQDYAYLVGHFNNGRIASFSQPTLETAGRAGLFAFDRDVLLATSVGLLLLAWMHRITMSEFFQLLLWVFVLFSPYLLPSEDWILCLLIVEGSIFKSTGVFVGGLKLVLLAVIFNVRDNIGLTDRLGFPVACVLLAMLVIEIVLARNAGSGGGPKGNPVLLATSV